MTTDTHHVDEENLGKLLNDLFMVKGETEVEIHHPKDGVVVYHKETWLKQQKELQRFLDMSPADRYQETKRLERLGGMKRKRMQIKFRTALIEAKEVTVDLDGEENFGIDVDGNKVDVEGMTFVRQEDYPAGTIRVDNEIGCFVEAEMAKPPVRILSQA